MPSGCVIEHTGPRVPLHLEPEQGTAVEPTHRLLACSQVAAVEHALGAPMVLQPHPVPTLEAAPSAHQAPSSTASRSRAWARVKPDGVSPEGPGESSNPEWMDDVGRDSLRVEDSLRPQGRARRKRSDVEGPAEPACRSITG